METLRRQFDPTAAPDQTCAAPPAPQRRHATMFQSRSSTATLCVTANDPDDRKRRRHEADPQPPSRQRWVAQVVSADPSLERQLSEYAQAVGWRVQSHTTLRALGNRASGDFRECILVDLRSPNDPAWRLLPQATTNTVHDAPCIAIVESSSVAATVRAMLCGVLEVLEDPVQHDDLAAVLDAARSFVLERRRQIDEDQLRRMRFQCLTAREREICELIVAGATNREMADGLGISVKTVEAHRAAVMRKTKARNLADLVRWAHGLQ